MSEPSAPRFLGDIPIDAARAALLQAAELACEYLEKGAAYRVLPEIAPGDVRKALPPSPPLEAEPLAAILRDYQALIEPNVTHWNHPGFMAYFATSGSAAGIVGEMLCAALNVNAMVWRSGPAPTELETLACDWLRQMLDLPAEFEGHINDTASMSSLLALAAARERAAPQTRTRGLAGTRPLTVYASEHAHSSIDKAAITLGIGLENVRRVAADDAFELRVDALADALRADRAAGLLPIAVVSTVGTTGPGSIDPTPAIAELCRAQGLWLHVDAAHAGSAGICPEYRALMPGLALADSLVVNPHKWLFTPMDCSVLLLRDPHVLRAAFAVTPEYLRTRESGVVNLMDYGPQLGRRFRALKLWMTLRAFGVRGLQQRIRYHCALARELAGWIAEDPRFELAAPAPLSLVCFRAVPDRPPEAQDGFNERLLERVNATGRVFLSHTKLNGRYVIRVAIGNLRTAEADVRTVWQAIRQAFEDESAAYRAAP